MSDTADTSHLVSIGTRSFDPVDAPAARRRRNEVRRGGDPDPNDTRIVQFHGALGRADKARLKDQYGLALSAYLPKLAYVERIDADTRRRLSRDPLVRAIASYPPEVKLAPAIEAMLDTADPDALIVATLFDGGSVDVVSRELRDVGAVDIDAEDNRVRGGYAYVSFRAPDRTAIERACQLADVRWLEPGASAKEDDVDASAVIQSGNEDNTPVWDRGLHGEGQIISILEFGTPDIDHCFFDDVDPNRPGNAHRKVEEVRRARVRDHATFVAGCALGDERGNSGNHSNRGSAWAARMVAVRLRTDAAGNVRMGDLQTQLENNRDAGATVHSNSWHDDAHGPGVAAPYNYVAIETDTFLRANEEHVVLGSSGNNGEEQGAPGTAKNALCVSAADSDGTDVDDGNPGPTADGRRKPDIVAVGCSITSAEAGSDCDMDDSPSCATSWATPHAAGAAALVRQYFMEGWWAGGVKDAANAITPSGALIRAVMLSSSVNMSGEPSYPNATEGWGILRLDRGLMFNDNGRNLVVRDIRNDFGLETGEEWTQGYTVGGDSNQLRVVLAYTDPAGTAGAANTLVNNLNLEVTDPNGVKFVGNDFDSTVGLSEQNSTDTGDTFNNIEVVLVNAPLHGAWEIKVKAANVAVDSQGFAIAATATNFPREFSKCFVATAVYGDAEHGDVMALRRWRREVLAAGGLSGTAMRVFSQIYLLVGPPAAAVVRSTPQLQRALRRRLFPWLVGTLASRSSNGRTRTWA